MPCKSEPTTSGVDHFWYQERYEVICTGVGFVQGRSGWSLHGKGVESAWKERKGWSLHGKGGGRGGQYNYVFSSTATNTLLTPVAKINVK